MVINAEKGLAINFAYDYLILNSMKVDQQGSGKIAVQAYHH